MSYADIIKKKQKEWNCPKLMNSIYEVQGERIPFSSPLFNWDTYGGVPRDKIIEFYGDYGSGKTTTAIDVCRNAAILFRKEFDEFFSLLKGGEGIDYNEFIKPVFILNAIDESMKSNKWEAVKSSEV